MKSNQPQRSTYTFINFARPNSIVNSLPLIRQSRAWYILEITTLSKWRIRLGCTLETKPFESEDNFIRHDTGLCFRTRDQLESNQGECALWSS
ncbi:hypothetical protein GJ496_002328 [Pomphorhynchus laevis]|nr:hypothetical protein GJ496_002328 [Pomphorhynchus laevis]